MWLNKRCCSGETILDFLGGPSIITSRKMKHREGNVKMAEGEKVI